MDNNTETSTATAKWSDQYKDPRWQKKRLEILEHDNFTCQLCGSKDRQLHVHHASYLKGNKIWDYDADSLITLCTDCHSRVHEVKDEWDEYITPSLFTSMRTGNGLNFFDVYNIVASVVYNECDLSEDVLTAIANGYRSSVRDEMIALKEWEESK